MKYTHGWSSARGRAKHLCIPDVDAPPYYIALCGSPIRIIDLSTKRMRALELCDHCEAARRRRKK